ncbi:MAG: hypothetical protein AAFU77_12400 [Myxococcota bacterium]
MRPLATLVTGALLSYPRAMRTVRISALFLLMACGSGEPSQIRIVDRDANGNAALVDVPRGGLESFDTLRSPTVEMYRSAVFDFSGGILDRGLLRDRIVTDEELAAARIRVAEDVAIATDLDSLGMLSLFVYSERTMSALDESEMPIPAPQVVYYNPVVDSDSLPSENNAAFSPGLDAFFSLPFLIDEGVPTSMSEGVVAHELGHRVFYYYGFGARQVEALINTANVPNLELPQNRILAVNEGVADFLAASLTRDTNPIALSFPSVADGRDLLTAREFPVDWLFGDNPRVNNRYDPYAVGVIFAGTLWLMAEQFGHLTVRRAVRDGLLALQERLLRFEFQFGDLMREVIEALPELNRPDACAIAADRYATAFGPVAAACP